MSDLIPASTTALAVEREKLREEARIHMDASLSPRTRRAYKADWLDFTTWCAHQGLAELPATADTVTLYVTHLAHSRKSSTVFRRLASISKAHRIAGHDSPTRTEMVRMTVAGIRRGKVEKGETVTQKDAAITATIRQLVEAFSDDTALHRRNRALILVGFAGAFRRSELVALDLSDISFTDDGVIVRLRRSKTDQEGAGTEKGIPYGSRPHTCPVRALRAWLDAAGITSGPIFRQVRRGDHVQVERLTAQSVALVIKDGAARAGLDPAVFAGHSLRSGLATAAAMAGVNERVIMEQTGHRSVVVARRYIRRGSLFRQNAAAEVGL